MTVGIALVPLAALLGDIFFANLMPLALLDGCNLKNDRIISVHFQGKPFNITVIQVYAPTINAKVSASYEGIHNVNISYY